MNDLSYYNVLGVGWKLSYTQQILFKKKVEEWLEKSNMKWDFFKKLSQNFYRIEIIWELGLTIVGNPQEFYLIRRLPTWCSMNFFHKVFEINLNVFQNNMFLCECRELFGEPCIINTRLTIEEGVCVL